MVPRFTIRNSSRTRSWLVLPLATLLALVLSGTLLTTPAHAANPVTPGNYRGLGFDQCEAPSQSAMSTWIKKSPFRAAGIYISGASRACQRQSNLSATWVRRQLAAGWHLMPITLGPQASCSTRYPRYGSRIDPTINPSTTERVRRCPGPGQARGPARSPSGTQPRPRARQHPVLRPRGLRHPQEHLLHPVSHPVPARLDTARCTAYGYASGYYSSAASGMRMMDDQRVKAGNTITMPDQIWIADWDGKANTSSSLHPQQRMAAVRPAKQYQGGHTETWGGVRINIDRNYLDLRTPRLAGAAPTPATSGPRYTGASMSDPRCTTEHDQQVQLPQHRRRPANRPDRPVAVHAQAEVAVPLRGHRPVEQPDGLTPCAASSAGWTTGCAATSPVATGSACSQRATPVPCSGRALAAPR